MEAMSSTRKATTKDKIDDQIFASRNISFHKAADQIWWKWASASSFAHYNCEKQPPTRPFSLFVLFGAMVGRV
jgi:hypothetical protein